MSGLATVGSSDDGSTPDPHSRSPVKGTGNADPSRRGERSATPLESLASIAQTGNEHLSYRGIYKLVFLHRLLAGGYSVTFREVRVTFRGGFGEPGGRPHSRGW